MIVPVILSGGSGTRLWPLSRTMYPKQFIRFFNGQGSLLGATLAPYRRRRLCRPDHHLQQRPPLPGARGAGARRAGGRRRSSSSRWRATRRRRWPSPRWRRVQTSADAIIAVMPSDHVVKDAAAFVASLQARGGRGGDRQARACSASCRPGRTPATATSGAALRWPATGGGYAVDAFFEKPDRATAETYVADQSYFWNSGIFVLHARTFLSRAGAAGAGDLGGGARGLRQGDGRSGLPAPRPHRLRARPQHLRRLRGDGEDAASGDDAHRRRLERRRLVVVAVGSWRRAMPRRTPSRAMPSSSIPATASSTASARWSPPSASRASSSSIPPTRCWSPIRAARRTCRGSSRASRSSTARSTRSTSAATARGASSRQLGTGDRFQVKLLHVKPGGQLSMQMHHHRSEHWVVVRGTAKVSIGDDEKLVRRTRASTSRRRTGTGWRTPARCRWR